MDAQISNLKDDKVIRPLRKAGMRVTRQRLIVYQALRELGGHRSADEILKELKQRKGKNVSRMSIYNTLEILCDMGVIMQADAGPGRTLHEANSIWHHHFVCRLCMNIFDVPCVKGHKPCLKLPSRIGKADEAQVIFRGICKSCTQGSGSH